MSGDGEVRYSIENPDKSLGDLVGDLTSQFAALVSDHIDLAKAEIKDDISQAARAGGMFGAAGVTGLLALIMLSAAAGWGLAEVMAPGWAFLIVGAIWAVVAGVLALTAKQQIDDVDPAPRNTIEELKEDKQWIKTQTN
jgi:uncharacterized membrane protein YqjE